MDVPELPNKGGEVLGLWKWCYVNKIEVKEAPDGKILSERERASPVFLFIRSSIARSISFSTKPSTLIYSPQASASVNDPRMNASAPKMLWVCEERTNLKSRGIFYGDNPLDFSTPILLAQFSVTAFLTSIVRYLLTPLGESAFVSQMLVGIALGPSFFGSENTILSAIFPLKSFYACETLAFFGCMFFMFLVGVKMDLGMLRKSGKKAIVIGLNAFFVPLAINMVFVSFLRSKFAMSPTLAQSVFSIAVLQCSSSFYVIACLLEDLKLLNSELGRLALSSSMISGMVSWMCMVIGFTARQTALGQRNALPWMVLCLTVMLLLIIFVLRPIVLWMVANTAKGKPIKETYVFWLFVMFLGCVLFSEVIGQHFMLGPMILGLAIPDGPPLGSALVDKLESFVSSILLPGYFVFSGARINLADVDMKTVGIVQLVVLCSFIGKLIGTMAPSLYCKMPLPDSLSLGLVMSTQGITDILILQHAMLLFLLDVQCYSVLVLTILLMTGIITPIIKILYCPSKRYRSQKRKRTIEHLAPNAELRLLVCLYRQDNTASIISLLQLSNPTLKTPICFYVVHLMQLTGRSSPLLITHYPGKRTSLHSNFSDHIINAFRLFQQGNNGKVIMNAFTSIAPYSTMHDDVCMLALEKRTSIVIVPFHKQRTLDGTEESANPLRSVNRNILSKAPCSVGILVDRGTLASKSLYRVGVFFIEGPDDREAIAYATRMAEHPNVAVSVIRIVYQCRNQRHAAAEAEMDSSVIDRFEAVIEGKKRHDYVVEEVKDSVGMINAIRSRDGCYDLTMVGRRHDTESELFMGLTEWNEFPELGMMGDMLASSDSNCESSVLVLQQHSIGGDQEIPETLRRDDVEEAFPTFHHRGPRN